MLAFNGGHEKFGHCWATAFRVVGLYIWWVIRELRCPNNRNKSFWNKFWSIPWNESSRQEPLKELGHFLSQESIVRMNLPHLEKMRRSYGAICWSPAAVANRFSSANLSSSDWLPSSRDLRHYHNTVKCLCVDRLVGKSIIYWMKVT